MTVYFRIETPASSMNRAGAGGILALFSNLESAKRYKQGLITSGQYAESDITITTTDAEGRAITA